MAAAESTNEPGHVVVRWGRRGGAGQAILQLADKTSQRTLQGNLTGAENDAAAVSRGLAPFCCTPTNRENMVDHYAYSKDKLAAASGDLASTDPTGRLKQHLRRSTSWYEPGRNGRR